MKSFLVFGFFLTVFAFSSGFYVKETAPLPQKTTITQNQPSKVLIFDPRVRKEQKIGRLVYLKNLMELRCLKKVLKNIRNKNRFRYIRPSNVIPLENAGIKNLKNQISKNFRENFSYVQPQNSRNNRIIFLTPNTRFPERELNEFLQNKTFYWNSNEASTNDAKYGTSIISDEDKPVKNINQTPPFVIDLPENNEKFSKIFFENESTSKPNTSSSNTKIHQKQNDLKSTPGGSQKQPKPIQIQPHDVRNTTNKNNEKLKSSHIGRKPTEKLYNDDYLTNRGHSGSRDTPKTYSSVKEFNSSINTVLKSLTKSNDSSITKTKEIIINSPSQTGFLSTNSKTYLNNRPIVSDKGTIEHKSFVNRKEQSKQLKITIPNSEKILQNFKKKQTETTTRKEESSKFTPTVRIEIENRISATNVTKVTNAPKSDLKIEKNTPSSHPNIQTTVMPEIYTFESFNRVLEVQKENQKSDVQTPFPVTITEDFTTELKEKSANTYSEIQTTLKQTTKEFINEKIISTDSPDEITNKMKEVATNVPELEFTTSDFKEFTDYPITFDLLTTIIKDEEAFGKNGRKMHFEPEILANTTSNQLGDSEQRRSDILINENSDDYILDESSSDLNYIEEIKQNSSLLSYSPNYIIKLIPVVINDLRENKISSEDILVLSKFFADHWTKVVALSNKTDLDMLPLLKMKNEEDLNNILRSNFPEESEITDSDKEETKYDNYTVYEYEDDYKSLNEDGSGEDFERGGRFKRDKEDAEYFDRIKNSLNKDDEKQKEEERFISELMNLKNVNSRTTNKVF